MTREEQYQDAVNHLFQAIRNNTIDGQIAENYIADELEILHRLVTAHNNE